MSRYAKPATAAKPPSATATSPPSAVCATSCAAATEGASAAWSACIAAPAGGRAATGAQLGLPLAARREATGLLRKCSGVEGKLTVCMVNNKQSGKLEQLPPHTSGAERGRSRRSTSSSAVGLLRSSRADAIHTTAGRAPGRSLRRSPRCALLSLFAEPSFHLARGCGLSCVDLCFHLPQLLSTSCASSKRSRRREMIDRSTSLQRTTNFSVKSP